MISLCKLNKCTNKSRIYGLCSKHGSKKYRLNNKKKALAYLGGKCINCGTTKMLEFDHIDPNNVSFRISQGLSYSFDRLKHELDKCQLLCRTCHWVKTCNDQNKKSYIVVPHGTTNAYCNRSCRCDLCKKAWSDYVRNKRALYKQRPNIINR